MRQFLHWCPRCVTYALLLSSEGGAGTCVDSTGISAIVISYEVRSETSTVTVIRVRQTETTPALLKTPGRNMT